MSFSANCIWRDGSEVPLINCMKRGQGKQNVSFRSTPFVLCGLPVRQSPAGEMLYERRNGNFVLQITGQPSYGLAFVRIGSCRSTLPRSRASTKQNHTLLHSH